MEDANLDNEVSTLTREALAHRLLQNPRGHSIHMGAHSNALVALPAAVGDVLVDYMPATSEIFLAVAGRRSLFAALCKASAR